MVRGDACRHSLPQPSEPRGRTAKDANAGAIPVAALGTSWWERATGSPSWQPWGWWPRQLRSSPNRQRLSCWGPCGPGCRPSGARQRPPSQAIVQPSRLCCRHLVTIPSALTPQPSGRSSWLGRKGVGAVAPTRWSPRGAGGGVVSAPSAVIPLAGITPCPPEPSGGSRPCPRSGPPRPWNASWPLAMSRPRSASGITPCGGGWRAEASAPALSRRGRGTIARGRTARSGGPGRTDGRRVAPSRRTWVRRASPLPPTSAPASPVPRC